MLSLALIFRLFFGLMDINSNLSPNTVTEDAVVVEDGDLQAMEDGYGPPPPRP